MDCGLHSSIRYVWYFCWCVTILRWKEVFHYAMTMSQFRERLCREGFLSMWPIFSVGDHLCFKNMSLEKNPVWTNGVSSQGAIGLELSHYPIAVFNNFTFELMFSKCSLRGQWWINVIWVVWKSFAYSYAPALRFRESHTILPYTQVPALRRAQICFNALLSQW